ncbi:MAG: A/G-specific adenine glycosylase [Chlorobi bacterium]|nr:A/G-specific adenine glycosylase [Chlorobiota bacterium]
MEIHERLHIWFQQNARALPWRSTRDPYRIWLSEIILQQTRVDQGLPYYERFIHRFPDIQSLASASDDEVMRLWEGLGYYRRAQNMLRAARLLSEQYGGQFPTTYDELLQLPGIGPYTAAAVASFAFDRPVAVADGNVMRVLARFTGKTEPVNTPGGQKIFRRLAQDFLDRRKPAIHNQALMELGALVCKPRQAKCENCPLRHKCVAYNQGMVEKLPVRQAKTAAKRRIMHYLLSLHNGHVAIRQRHAEDIWRHLYEFIPVPEKISPNAAKIKALFGLMKKPRKITTVKHQLTHRRLELHFWFTDEKISSENYISASEINNYSLPVPLRKIWEDLAREKYIL